MLNISVHLIKVGPNCMKNISRNVNYTYSKNAISIHKQTTDELTILKLKSVDMMLAEVVEKFYIKSARDIFLLSSMYIKISGPYFG